MAARGWEEFGVQTPDPRTRLFEGLADAIIARGYRDTTVADIVRAAKTSKRTFYTHFTSKDDCLLELLDADNVTMIATIRAAVDPEADFPEQITAAVDAYVTVIENRPAVTLTWIREFPALGEAAYPVQRRGMDRFAELLLEITANPGFARAGLAPISRATAVILLGGLRELTAQTMEDGGSITEITAAAIAACIGLVTGPRPTASAAPAGRTD
ncbi:TetR family transcriptional regulator [Mycolicibacterium fallax]|uniref:TetR family transcriptional regulator n=1 Tax=Mycolicibacterium fallax TaxID=1793 RepID=A0A1X1R5N8_MYCFA|nr:TetR family transcriptional regulator [Mycolicibacterium fallax]